MLQRGSVNGIALLNQFIAAEPGRYLPITTADMRLAAQFWAQARNAGTPTADPLSLDADVILAAQVANLLLPSGTFIIATSNVRHLTQFVAAEEWHKIRP